MFQYWRGKGGTFETLLLLYFSRMQYIYCQSVSNFPGGIISGHNSYEKSLSRIESSDCWSKEQEGAYCLYNDRRFQIDRNKVSKDAHRLSKRQLEMEIENSVANPQATGDGKNIQHVNPNYKQIGMGNPYKSNEHMSSMKIEVPICELTAQSSTLNSSQTLSVLAHRQDVSSDECPPPTYRSLIDLIIEDAPPSYDVVTGEKVPYDEVRSTS